MLPSCFPASFLGATPSSDYLTAYHRFQRLSRVHPDLLRFYPLSLPASHLRSSFCPSFSVTMTTPETSANAVSCVRPSSSDLAKNAKVGVANSGCEDLWGNSGNEEWQEKAEDDTTDRKTSNTANICTDDSDDGNKLSWSEPRAQTPRPPNASAMKFSIDSILGLKTKASNDPSLVIKASGMSTAEAISGSVESCSFDPYCQQNVVKSYSPDHHRALQRSGKVVGDELTNPREEKEGGRGEVNAMGEERSSFSWLQCTRYHPPKLQHNKKKDGGGKKRKLGRNPRVPFTQHQVAVLEEKFRRTHYLSSMDVIELSAALTLSETRVKIWFQNRRARERREIEASQRSQHLTPKPYQPLTIPSVPWALTSQLVPSPFCTPYRNDMNFQAGLFSSAFSAFSTPVRHDVSGTDNTSSAACSWADNLNSDEDTFY